MLEIVIKPPESIIKSDVFGPNYAKALLVQFLGWLNSLNEAPTNSIESKEPLRIEDIPEYTMGELIELYKHKEKHE